ncbi:DUF5995 family protein [Paenibacillus allorhizosphaerae]|uniref:Uncharacterized protein n=1 Tax=Paenibacillus allorhizosphaerae TaxID=2849866 RepID=A0ABM8VNC9_9BACL|nr:DUF5995 family protein [Paenibacillus allorhizosphaerae]CAG7651119.1 hypothetical protein PAECIP111802_04891 [Paenibacillus allorhizosphaerae]
MNDIAQNPNEQPSSIQQVIDEMTRRLDKLQGRQDHRVIFQRVYLLMTKEMHLRLENGFFRDTMWMERVLVRFACYYFEAEIQGYQETTIVRPKYISINSGLVFPVVL